MTDILIPCTCCRRQSRVVDLDADLLCRACRLGEADRERAERSR